MRQDKRQPTRRGPAEPSQSSAVFPLPKDTTALVRAYSSKCQNLGLWLDRFVLYERRGNQWEQSRQSKKREGAPLNFQPLNQLLAACRRRWDVMLQSYGHDLARFTATTEWRLSVGLGGSHVLETGLTLHRIYGIPFIPASAVKGVTRAQRFWEIAQQLSVPQENFPSLDRLLTEGEVKKQKEHWEKTELRGDFAYWQEVSHDFYSVFGTTEARGNVTFFDAYPTEVPRVKLDIMNPHYVDYYQQKIDKTGKPTPPAGYLSPVPVYFLTVERTPFEFALASQHRGLGQTAQAWLKAGLATWGIGSKTAAGYGFFGSS